MRLSCIVLRENARGRSEIRARFKKSPGLNMERWGDFDVDLHKPNAHCIAVFEKPAGPIDSFFACLRLVGEEEIAFFISERAR